MTAREMLLCTIDKEDGELVTLRLAPVDLGKLLALADELGNMSEELPPAFRDMGASIAHRIREALGMES